MPQRQFLIFIVQCLGRLEPEGGVVLGIHLDYDIFYVFYILSHLDYILYHFAYVYILCMHPLLNSIQCRYLRITLGTLVSVQLHRMADASVQCSAYKEHESSLYLTSQLYGYWDSIVILCLYYIKFKLSLLSDFQPLQLSLIYIHASSLVSKLNILNVLTLTVQSNQHEPNIWFQECQITLYRNLIIFNYPD